MDPLHMETPLFESRALSHASGRTTWPKLEAVQPPGSFKIRGIGLACQEYARRGARRFISSSGGKAGIAVAYAGRRLGVPVVVVVPETTTYTAKAMIRQESAEVLVHGATWSIPGSIIGEIVMIAAPEIFRAASEYRMVILGAFMVLMMIFKPEGLLGKKLYEQTYKV